MLARTARTGRLAGLFLGHFLPSGMDNLAASELAKQVLVLCFGEFGRRLQKKARSVGARSASFPWKSRSVVNGNRLFGSKRQPGGPAGSNQRRGLFNARYRGVLGSKRRLRARGNAVATGSFLKRGRAMPKRRRNDGTRSTLGFVVLRRFTSQECQR
jgi:hypothetical protein